MSNEINVFALFCEDVRREADKKNSLMGVLPNTINVPDFPGVLLRLCVYIRVNFGMEFDSEDIPMKLILPSGEELNFTSIDRELLKKSQAEAKQQNKTVAGVLTIAEFRNLAIEKPGAIRVTARIKQQDQLCGILHVEKIADQFKS